MHDVKELVAQYQLDPVKVLQQLARVRWREEDRAQVERNRCGEAVREVGGVEYDELRAPPWPPVEQCGGADIHPLGDAGDRLRMWAILLGKMDVEVFSLERAPIEPWIGEVQLVPLRPSGSAHQREQHKQDRQPQSHPRVIAA